MPDVSEISSLLNLASSYTFIDDWVDITYDVQTADAFFARSSAPFIFKSRRIFRQVYLSAPLQDKLDVHEWLNQWSGRAQRRRVGRKDLEMLEKRFNGAQVELELFSRAVFGLDPLLVQEMLAVARAGGMTCEVKSEKETTSRGRTSEDVHAFESGNDGDDAIDDITFNEEDTDGGVSLAVSSSHEARSQSEPHGKEAEPAVKKKVRKRRKRNTRNADSTSNLEHDNLTLGTLSERNVQNATATIAEATKDTNGSHKHARCEDQTRHASMKRRRRRRHASQTVLEPASAVPVEITDLEEIITSNHNMQEGRLRKKRKRRGRSSSDTKGAVTGISSGDNGSSAPAASTACEALEMKKSKRRRKSRRHTLNGMNEDVNHSFDSRALVDETQLEAQGVEAQNEQATLNNDPQAHSIAESQDMGAAYVLLRPSLPTVDTVDSAQDTKEYSYLGHISRQLSPEVRRPDMIWGLKYTSDPLEQDPRLTDEENRRMWKVFCQYGCIMRPRHESLLLKRRSEELSLTEFVREIEDGTLDQFLKLYKKKVPGKDYEGGAARLIKGAGSSSDAGIDGDRQLGVDEMSRISPGAGKAPAGNRASAESEGSSSAVRSQSTEDITGINILAQDASKESTGNVAPTKNAAPQSHNRLLDSDEPMPYEICDEALSSEDIAGVYGDLLLDTKRDESSTQVVIEQLTTPAKSSMPVSSSMKNSPYFDSQQTNFPARKKRTPAGTFSSIPFPPITSNTFGLIQEKLADDPFRLLVAVTFLNKTRGTVAIPIFYELMKRYPTPEALSQANIEEVVSLIRHLGFQNLRAAKLINLAKTWLASPPLKNVRYRTLNYPYKGAGRGIKPNVPISDDLSRIGAWEIAHLPGCGDYAIDSWRIFCRDKLRDVATDWDGGGDTDPDFQPEWTQVLPNDKELRAFLRWRWLKEGFEWDPWTGRVCAASPELLAQAKLGNESWQEQQAVVQGKKKIVVAREFAVVDSEEHAGEDENGIEMLSQKQEAIDAATLNVLAEVSGEDNAGNPTPRRSGRIKSLAAVAVRA